MGLWPVFHSNQTGTHSCPTNAIHFFHEPGFPAGYDAPERTLRFANSVWKPAEEGK